MAFNFKYFQLQCIPNENPQRIFETKKYILDENKIEFAIQITNKNNYTTNFEQKKWKKQVPPFQKMCGRKQKPKMFYAEIETGVWKKLLANVDNNCKE